MAENNIELSFEMYGVLFGLWKDEGKSQQEFGQYFAQGKRRNGQDYQEPGRAETDYPQSE